MLVLTRKLMESIVIGGNIRITVTHVDRDRVKIGIEAPREIVVVREELLAKPANKCDRCRGKGVVIVDSVYGSPPEYGDCPRCKPAVPVAKREEPMPFVMSL